jgi:hypothetical protein
MPQGYVGRPFGRPFGSPLPIVQEITGDRGEAVRHVLARGAFMRAVCEHPRVVATFADWVGSALNAAARECANARDDYARLFGFEGRADMFHPSFADAELLARIEKPAEAERKAAVLQQAEEAFADAMTAARVDPTSLVDELLNPAWAWIVYDLRSAFYRSVLSEVCGVGIAPRLRIEKRDVRTWHLAASYTPGDIGVLEVVPVADGSRLPVDGTAVERDARWFYRHRVLGNEIDSLAQEYCEEERAKHHYPHQGSYEHSWQNDRKTVFDGINKTERLLSAVTRYFIAGIASTDDPKSRVD